MAISWTAVKDPGEVKDYKLDWTGQLGADAIASSEWSIASGGDGLTIDSDTYSNSDTIDDADAKSATVWLSAGIVDTTYDLVNTITTTGQRTLKQTVRLKVRAK